MFGICKVKKIFSTIIIFKNYNLSALIIILNSIGIIFELNCNYISRYV